MSERRIKVPEGILEAAWKVTADKMKASPESGHHVAELHVARIAVEAALRWLSENPSTMNRYDFNPHYGEEGMVKTPNGDYVLYCDAIQIFVEPEPVVPNEIADLLWYHGTDVAKDHDAKVIEAFKRGQRSVK